MSKLFLISVVLLMLVLPVSCILIEGHVTVMLAGKWFVFWAMGVRLLVAGLRQAIQPGFTAQQIFHIQDTGSHAVVRELGFANICSGLLGMASLWLPTWRMAAAAMGGLYYGLAAVMHVVKRPAGGNEWVALVSDVFITIVLVVFLCFTWQS